MGEAVGLGAATVAVAVGAGAGLGVSAVSSTAAAGEEAVPAALGAWVAEQALVAASNAAERNAAAIEGGQSFIGKPISLPRARFSPGVRSAKRAGVEIVRL